MGIYGISSGYSRYPGTVGNSSAENTRRSGATNLVEAAAGQNSDGDILQISAEAEMLANAAEARSPWSLLGLQGLFGGAAEDGRISIDEMEEMQEQSFSSVQARLISMFTKQGIDTSHEIRLQVAGDGRVIVANDHPQKAEIEKMINDNEDLRNDFVKMTSLTEMVGSMKESLAFQEAYAKDPYAAVAQYSYLFDSSNKANVCLSILGDQFTALYERPGAATISVGGTDEQRPAEATRPGRSYGERMSL